MSTNWTGKPVIGPGGEHCIRSLKQVGRLLGLSDVTVAEYERSAIRKIRIGLSRDPYVRERMGLIGPVVEEPEEIGGLFDESE